MVFSQPSGLHEWPAGLAYAEAHQALQPVSSYPRWPGSGLLQCSILTSFTAATALVSCCFKYFFSALWSIASLMLMNKGLPSVRCRAIVSQSPNYQLSQAQASWTELYSKRLWTCPTTKHNLCLYSTFTWEMESGKPCSTKGPLSSVTHQAFQIELQVIIYHAWYSHFADNPVLYKDWQ